jgi:hypothetical protein
MDKELQNIYSNRTKLIKSCEKTDGFMTDKGNDKTSPREKRFLNYDDVPDKPKSKGRPLKIKITEQMLKDLADLSEIGLSHKSIATKLKLKENHFEKLLVDNDRFREAYQDGVASGEEKIKRAAMSKAEQGDFSMLKFLLERRYQMIEKTEQKSTMEHTVDPIASLMENCDTLSKQELSALYKLLTEEEKKLRTQINLPSNIYSLKK